MNTYSPEYWRGVTDAYNQCYDGKDPGEVFLPNEKSEDYRAGLRAQCAAWPVKILPPADAQPRPTNFACGVFAGLALFGFLVIVLGFPKLSGPVLGCIAVATAVCAVAAYRNLKP